MRFVLFTALAAASLSAQVQPAPAVDSSTLPGMAVGVGPSWSRGDVHSASAEVNVSVKLGNSNWYSWSTISTPVAVVPQGSAPLASSITTGAAAILAQSKSGSVLFIGIAQGGFQSIQATGAISAAVTGSAGLAIRLGKSNCWLMPYMKASNPTRGTDGALVSAVLQPGMMFIYGFGGK